MVFEAGNIGDYELNVGTHYRLVLLLPVLGHQQRVVYHFVLVIKVRLEL